MHNGSSRKRLSDSVAVEHWRQRTVRFVQRDHKPLIHACTSSTDRSARVQRHLAFLSEFSTDIRHIGGTDNMVSDCLSRPPS
uniref:Reverse transcriptase RNase H-like domain-containing protein n=1 Tax=Trichuris muris TaxID=70415 RepID=A0A5S6QZZ1_TRIMR